MTNPQTTPNDGLFGRRDELAELRTTLDADGPELLFLTGLPGIGKSVLLNALARGEPQRVRILDCRTIEPTRAAFEDAVREPGPLEDFAGVLCLDHYEHFLLLDTWLRQEFLPRVGDTLRLIVVSRNPVGLGWLTSGRRTRTVTIDVLAAEASLALLEARGHAGASADAILQFTKGHPLALELAAAGMPASPDADLASPDVVMRLTQYFLEQVETPELRAALEVCACVRRLTRPVLEDVMGGECRADLFEGLAALPLTELRSDGLSLHPTVHETVASWLRTTDPARFTRTRQRAWATLERRGKSVGARELWRYTADVVFLIDDPVIREAFFPTNAHPLVVEPAAGGDHDAILAIVEQHDGAASKDSIERWLAIAPGAFHVVRRAPGSVDGFYCLLDPASIDEAAIEADPITREWWHDLPGALRGGRRRVFFLRRWLDANSGDVPSPVQGACWLDIKRHYLEARPLLQRVYLGVDDLTPYLETAARLGFVPIETSTPLPLHSAMLEFGPGSVDAWLGRLVRQSLGLGDELALDRDRHALTIEGHSVPLTPREFAVVELLTSAEGAVVRRDQLMRDVWAGGVSVGSNVVEVLIRGLRKKLGPHADAIVTVRGVGYRWDS